MISSSLPLQPMRLAFIGGGVNSAIGNTHRIASQLDGRWKLVCGVFSRNSEINSISGDAYGLDRSAVCSGIDELISRGDEFDAVSVLSPTNLHFQHISDLIKNNIQVISEKSLVSSVPDAVKLVEIQESMQKSIFVTFNYTAYPMVREMQARIADNHLGKILFVQIEMPQEGFLKLNNFSEKPKVQEWRKVDGDLSTLSLDLGVHTQSLVHFVTGLKGEKFIGVKVHRGLVSNAIDYVSALGKYENGVDLNVWYGKTALGSRNGLRLRVYGEQGSFEWEHVYPDRLIFANQVGERQFVDPGSWGLIEANKLRYQRFKPGHPTGFIEAFANYYEDLYSVLSVGDSHGTTSKYLFSASNALQGLKEIQAIERSSSTESWQTV